MTNPSICVLTGYRLEKPLTTSNVEATLVTYEFAPVGKVKIGLMTRQSFINNNQLEHPILAGICRNAFEDGQEPPIITTDYIQNDLKNLSYPKTFKEKYRHLLKYMYNRGGNDFKPFSFSSALDYTLCFCDNHEEFKRVMEYLKDNFLIVCKNEQTISMGVKLYHNVQMTDSGIEEVEKELPNIPMIGLVNQEISTGDIEIDKKINHAKDLFFMEPQTMDRMRSACETLIYILEPLREKVKKYFKGKDTEVFFNLVNTFDIRHNKEHTKDIEHPEQLEWIFYSLLNTINTYTKLEKRYK